MTYAPRGFLRPLYFLAVIVVTVLATQSLYMKKHLGAVPHHHIGMPGNSNDR